MRLLLTALLLMSTPVLASTWYVHQGGLGDATTIQSGIDLASAGDTVLVAPGVYTDTLLVTIEGEQKVANVYLNKEISLVAEGDTSNTVILGPNSDVAVFVEGVGSGGLIQGFRIETEVEYFFCADGIAVRYAAAVALGPRIGIWCEDASLGIVGNKVTNHKVAVVLRRSPTILVANEISWAYDGIVCEDGSDASVSGNALHSIAIALTATHSAPSVMDNEFGGKGQMCDAVDCNEGGDAYIARNRFDNIRPETVIVGPADVTIEDNVFTNGSTAIFISAGTHTPVVRSNIFYDHGSWVIQVRSGAVIEHNTIDYAPGNSTRGISVQWANPQIRNNILSRLSAGISCVLGASPTIECNNIYATTYPYHNECPDLTGINGNISVDPQFCGAWDSGNWELQSDSPCAPGNHPDGYSCGRIGAKEVGCSTTPTKKMSWGALKALLGGEEKK